MRIDILLRPSQSVPNQIIGQANRTDWGITNSWHNIAFGTLTKIIILAHFEMYIVSYQSYTIYCIKVIWAEIDFIISSISLTQLITWPMMVVEYTRIAGRICTHTPQPGFLSFQQHKLARIKRTSFWYSSESTTAKNSKWCSRLRFNKNILHLAIYFYPNINTPLASVPRPNIMIQ